MVAKGVPSQLGHLGMVLVRIRAVREYNIGMRASLHPFHPVLELAADIRKVAVPERRKLALMALRTGQKRPCGRFRLGRTRAVGTQHAPVDVEADAGADPIEDCRTCAD